MTLPRKCLRDARLRDARPTGDPAVQTSLDLLNQWKCNRCGSYYTVHVKWNSTPPQAQGRADAEDRFCKTCLFGYKPKPRRTR